MIGALPDELVRNVVGAWRGDGARWLAELPAIVQQIALAWGLSIGAPFELSYHYVAAVTCADGTPAVLKLGVPEGRSLVAEGIALAAYDGRGAVRLLRADLARGALLLERVAPGERLRDLVPDRDAEATSALVEVMRRVHVAPRPGCSLPDVQTYAESFDEYLVRHGDAGPLPRALVERAARLIRALCASAPRSVVLHGDLHHDNVLRARREPWLAIDPHGLVGDPGYDVGALLYNPEPPRRDPALTALVPARIEQLAAELAMPRERVVAWGFVKAVLSDVWSVEDWAPGATDPVSRALDVAQLLAVELP